MRSASPTELVFYDDGTGSGDGVGGQPGGDGGSPSAAGGQPWYTALPEGDLRSDPNITKYGSLEDFARGHINQAKLIGKPADRLIELPGAEDTAGRVAVLRKLGAPEALDGYKLAPVEGLDESLSPDGGLAKMFLTAAHKHAILPEQAQAIYAEVAAGLNQAITEDNEATALEQQQGTDKLKAEWGPAFDQNVAAAKFGRDKIAEKAGIPAQELADAFDRHLQHDPIMVKAFSAIGKMFGEDSAGKGAGGFNSILAPAEAESKGRELLQQAMREKDIHEKRRLNTEAAKYFQMAYPENAA